jgi:CheY-like chemotaxis protein
MRTYLRTQLEVIYNIIEAEHGIQGLERVHETRPDLIISDVMMPRMDGIMLVQKLKQNPDLTTIPVILLTARADEVGRIAVYNTLGQQVAVLANGLQPAGRHHITWNAEAQASGLYLVRMETDRTGRHQTIATHRMVLLK